MKKKIKIISLFFSNEILVISFLYILSFVIVINVFIKVHNPVFYSLLILLQFFFHM